MSIEIDKDVEALQNKTAWVVAGKHALIFTSVVLLVTCGVGSPVIAAVTLEVQISAITVAADVNLALDSKTFEDLVQTVAGLEATRATLQTSVFNMQTVKFAILYTLLPSLTSC